MILAIRTDKPEAEIALYTDGRQMAAKTWTAHRQLAETLHAEIQSLLESQNKSWKDITGIVCYKGPGSFTGLRIGLSVANTLAYSLEVPISGQTGDDWIDEGIVAIQSGAAAAQVFPEYGQEVHITKPKH